MRRLMLLLLLLCPAASSAAGSYWAVAPELGAYLGGGSPRLVTDPIGIAGAAVTYGREFHPAATLIVAPEAICAYSLGVDPHGYPSGFGRVLAGARLVRDSDLRPTLALHAGYGSLLGNFPNYRGGDAIEISVAHVSALATNAQLGFEFARTESRWVSAYLATDLFFYGSHVRPLWTGSLGLQFGFGASRVGRT